MTEGNKARPDRWPPGRWPASRWWLLVKDGGSGVKVLVVDHGDERTLPVFSGEGEAEMFVWLRGAFEDDWRVRETSAGELVSILYGPCTGVGSVALDPSSEMAAETIRQVSVRRERFVSWIVDSPCSFSSGASSRHQARGLVRLH